MSTQLSRSAISKGPKLPRQAYTMAEVAGLLGVTYSSVWDQVQMKSFPVTPIRIGRAYRFPKQSIDQLLHLTCDTSLDPAGAD